MEQKESIEIQDKDRIEQTKFVINKPDDELTSGYVTVIVKYLVLFSFTWIGGWFLYLFLPAKHMVSPIDVKNRLDNAALVSTLIALVFVAYFSYRLYKKAKYGLLKSIAFEQDEVQLTIINLVNGNLKSRTIQSNAFRVDLNEKKHFVYGELRKFTLKENETILTYLNLDLTAWKRHEHIDQLYDQLKKYCYFQP